MAALAGYGVRIIDPRSAFATEARFPGVELSHDWPDEALTKAPLGAQRNCLSEPRPEDR